MAQVGRELGEREGAHRAELDEARRCAAALRAQLADALEGFREAVSAAGAPHLAVSLGELRPDDKHARAVEFDLARGRHRAIVTVRARGEVTLVGPFHAGKTEGPCKTFPFAAETELQKALGDFLENFLAEAATP